MNVPLTDTRAVCAVKVYPCGPKLHSKYFPYIRNCCRPVYANSVCWQHNRMFGRQLEKRT